MDERLKKIIDGSDKVVFFGGAGVSTESGIPDFRSEDGLYRAKQEYGVPPEEMLSHSFYMAHKDIFYRYYKENLVHPDAEPNAAHRALARLEDEGKVTAVITQNVDGLHQKAGSRNVIELHGSCLRNYCEKCGREYSLEYIMDESNCSGGVPKCSCGGDIKPDVVLYEEALDEDNMRAAVRYISDCDTLIIGGTSLAVYPAAGMIGWFRGKNLVLINKSPTPMDGSADLCIYEPIGEVMDLD